MNNGVLEQVIEQISDEELALINTYTRRKLTAPEVFAFSLTLCDNEIDRDFERFSIEALQTLKTLFLGKTGLFDHSMKGRDQVARIFHAEVEAVTGRVTAAGEPYHRLKARAYMPHTSKNGDMILEIDAGIKKEVSVGCRVGKRQCSVCGANHAGSAGCRHQKGSQIGKGSQAQLCHVILSEPQDAYEWSFVAVPAQPAAGVTKMYRAESSNERDKGGNEMEPETIMKSLSGGEELTLTAGQCATLAAYLSDQRALADAGKAYLAELRREVAARYVLERPALSADIVQSVCEKMSLRELREFADDSHVKTDKSNTLPIPQLSPRKPGVKAEENAGFII